MSRGRAHVVAVLVAAIAPAGANAQSTPRFAVEGGAAYSYFRAADLPTGGDGVAIDAQARMNLSAFSLGVGVVRAKRSK